MLTNRACGVLLHPTSLPGEYGIGDIGEEARRFVDILERTRQKIWQILPLGTTGYGNSPYQSFSAFAGNPLLISMERLADAGWIGRGRLAVLPEGDGSVDYDRVRASKLPLPLAMVIGPSLDISTPAFSMLPARC